MQEVGREEGVNLEEWNGDQIESLFEYVFVFGNTVRESDRERKTTEKEGGRGNDEQDKICAEKKKNPSNGIFPSNEKYDEGDGWTMTWLHIGR